MEWEKNIDSVETLAAFFRGLEWNEQKNGWNSILTLQFGATGKEWCTWQNQLHSIKSAILSICPRNYSTVHSKIDWFLYPTFNFDSHWFLPCQERAQLD